MHHAHSTVDGVPDGRQIKRIEWLKKNGRSSVVTETSRCCWSDRAARSLAFRASTIRVKIDERSVDPDSAAH